MTGKISQSQSSFRCLCVYFRRTDGVPQDRYAWQHPESVCHHPSTLVISPADHMEELWMWRWACESNFSIILLYWTLSHKNYCYCYPVNSLTCYVSLCLILMPQLSVWALCVCWRALQHILPFQTASALCPVLPRWTPAAQPQRKRQHDLGQGKGEVTRPLTNWWLATPDKIMDLPYTC